MLGGGGLRVEDKEGADRTERACEEEEERGSSRGRITNERRSQGDPNQVQAQTSMEAASLPSLLP
jgi:hypothetical protein